MLNSIFKQSVLAILLVLLITPTQAQQKVLGIKEAEEIALNNYGTIKAKSNNLNASKAFLTETKTEALPDVNISAQQDYGTVNGTTGPLYGYKGLSVASSGPSLANQNWNAAFGSLYLSNVSWDFFSFGKARERIKVQGQIVTRDASDLEQERFQHQIRVASTYLNLLVAQQLAKAQEDNLKRATDVQTVVVARVKNGLNPGVDSSLANAEVSNAKIALTNAQQTVQDQNTQLAIYMGVPPQNFELDSAFIKKSPPNPDPQPATDFSHHPELNYFRSLIGVSDEQAKYLNTFAYPTFTLFGIYQGRGSGFNSAYGNGNLNAYSGSYGAGADPTRLNYLFGVGMIWNITTPFRVHYQVKSQKFTSLAYQNQYDLVDQQLRDQTALAITRINNSLKNFKEAPIEVKASTDAYNQKAALYKNGLANIVDFTTALFTLNRAEIDLDISLNNVWQAILSKAAATGDFGVFINNF